MTAPKLIRDLIPQVIAATGAVPVCYTAGPGEYRARLRDKLREEVAEFLDADDEGAPGELADVLEVVHALAADLGIGVDGLEEIRAAKAVERGGFTGRVIWTGNRAPPAGGDLADVCQPCRERETATPKETR